MIFYRKYEKDTIILHQTFKKMHIFENLKKKYTSLQTIFNKD